MITTLTKKLTLKPEIGGILSGYYDNERGWLICAKAIRELIRSNPKTLYIKASTKDLGKGSLLCQCNDYSILYVGVGVGE